MSIHPDDMLRSRFECVFSKTLLSGRLHRGRVPDGKARYHPHHLVIYTMFTKYFMAIHTK